MLLEGQPLTRNSDKGGAIVMAFHSRVPRNFPEKLLAWEYGTVWYAALLPTRSFGDFVPLLRFCQLFEEDSLAIVAKRPFSLAIRV